MCCVNPCGPGSSLQRKLRSAQAWVRFDPREPLPPPVSTPLLLSTPNSHVLFPQIEGTQKLLNKDLAELINKMRLAQQNAVTSLSEECKRQMLTASHTLAVDAKNLLDAVDQAKVQANLAHPPAE